MHATTICGLHIVCYCPMCGVTATTPLLPRRVRCAIWRTCSKGTSTVRRRLESEGPVPHEKFDASRLGRLDDETRFEYLNPEVMWGAAGQPDPAVIVDIGAGTGLFARRFARMCS